MNKLRVLFLNELADMYDTEKRIIKALPKLARAATCKQLKAAFLSHLEETKEHKVKIRQVFKEFGEKPRGRRCAATIGLIKEGEKAAVENKGHPTIMRWTPSFRPLSAENKMASGGLLSWLLLFVSRSLCALNPFGKERTSPACHCPSSLSRLMGFQYLPPKAV
jgi:hypothetical protein